MIKKKDYGDFATYNVGLNSIFCINDSQKAKRIFDTLPKRCTLKVRLQKN